MGNYKGNINIKFSIRFQAENKTKSFIFKYNAQDTFVLLRYPSFSVIINLKIRKIDISFAKRARRRSDPN